MASVINLANGAVLTFATSAWEAFTATLKAA